jgi:hypothetical protein
MTKEIIQNLSLGIAPIDDRAVLIIGSGLEWLEKNTTLEFDIENEESIKALPSCAKLFLVEFFDIQMLSVGVTSQSIEGMSQSFDTSNSEDMIWKSAEKLLDGYLKSRIRFVAASSRWL